MNFSALICAISQWEANKQHSKSDDYTAVLLTIFFNRIVCTYGRRGIFISLIAHNSLAAESANNQDEVKEKTMAIFTHGTVFRNKSI